MFAELYEICKTAALLMSISADEATGIMTINVTPKPKKDNGEPSLNRALTLTATPAELEEGFAGALTTYQTKRLSLAEQVESTAEVLDAAKAAQAAKAKKATTAASKPAGAVKPGARAPEPDGDHGENDDENGSPSTSSAATGQEQGDTAPQLF